MTRAVAVIPARYGSTRLPAKSLLAETGKPLVVHVLERARLARRLSHVIVATDDARIAAAVRAAGGDARMTRADHATGTDRIGELLPTLDAETIVNVQGDEPEIEPDLLDALVDALDADAEIGVATAATPIRERTRFDDPNFVKVVIDRLGRALYFSRSRVPGGRPGDPDVFALGARPLLHVGVYAYRRTALESFLSLPPSMLERSESLEQLRLLENGVRYGVVVREHAARGVDTPADYAEFVRRALATAPLPGR